MQNEMIINIFLANYKYKTKKKIKTINLPLGFPCSCILPEVDVSQKTDFSSLDFFNVLSTILVIEDNCCTAIDDEVTMAVSIFGLFRGGGWFSFPATSFCSLSILSLF